jgi:cold shock CspA family protein
LAAEIIPPFSSTNLTQIARSKDAFMMGRITFYNTVRNYGFILCADGSSIFFHKNSCDKEPVLSANVSFDVAPPFREGKPPQAVKVVILAVAGGE